MISAFRATQFAITQSVNKDGVEPLLLYPGNGMVSQIS
jgi:hypothetical protein